MSFISSLQDFMRAYLADKRRIPKLLVVADHFDLSERTVRRRLSEAGLTYQQLKDEARKEVVIHHHRYCTSLDRLAQLAGYLEPRSMQTFLHKL